MPKTCKTRQSTGQSLTGNVTTLRNFFQYVKYISNYSKKLQKLKRRLSEAVNKMQDYIQCFKLIDLDKKGIISPKIMQNYLIQHKYYFDPASITRYYSKYSHQKQNLAYQDILQALLPHQDYILVSHTISDVSQLINSSSKQIYSCQRQRIKTIQQFTSNVISEEIKYLAQDYNMMRKVTNNSQRVGAILWRLLDRNHTNQLTINEIKISSNQLGIQIQQIQWQNFLYWHLHSYKRTINRADFMKILDIHQERKRATSACKIQQFKIKQELFKRAQENRLCNIRIQQSVKEKLLMMPHIQQIHYKRIVKEEHFPYGHLNQKIHLKGKLGYSKPINLIKYVVEIK